MLTAIAVTMPTLSVILPMITPPRPKPRKIMVTENDILWRVVPNSACTVGMTTTTDHMPTAPIEAINKATTSRTQA